MDLFTQDKIDLKVIVKALKQGKTLVYPTETCYGLGCDASNNEAVDKIFKIKNRQKNKAVLVVVPDIVMIKKYVEWSELLQNLADKYWPGPLTIVAPIKNDCNLANGVLDLENKTLAFRVTKHPLASQISRELGKPLVSTSANLASYESPYDIESVLNMFKDSKNTPDLIIDAGSLSYKNPSTIIKVIDDNIEVLRQGEIII